MHRGESQMEVWPFIRHVRAMLLALVLETSTAELQRDPAQAATVALHPHLNRRNRHPQIPNMQRKVILARAVRVECILDGQISRGAIDGTPRRIVHAEETDVMV